MSKTAHVVEGEASESESEIELGKSPEVESMNIDNFVIPGEAPESDDETSIKSNSTSIQTASDIADIQQTSQQTNAQKFNYTSLLHQKLWECNVRFRATIDGLLRHTTELAVDKLTRSDRGLLSVQESMRATNASLTLARARLKLAQTGLENTNCGAALPTVKIK